MSINCIKNTNNMDLKIKFIDFAKNVQTFSKFLRELGLQDSIFSHVWSNVNGPTSNNIISSWNVTTFYPMKTIRYVQRISLSRQLLLMTAFCLISSRQVWPSYIHKLKTISCSFLLQFRPCLNHPGTRIQTWEKYKTSLDTAMFIPCGISNEKSMVHMYVKTCSIHGV